MPRPGIWKITESCGNGLSEDKSPTSFGLNSDPGSSCRRYNANGQRVGPLQAAMTSIAGHRAARKISPVIPTPLSAHTHTHAQSSASLHMAMQGRRPEISPCETVGPLSVRPMASSGKHSKSWPPLPRSLTWAKLVTCHSLMAWRSPRSERPG